MTDTLAASTRVVSAPGKLVLIGEYAVLDGFDAVATAVTVRATARVAPHATLAIAGGGAVVTVRATMCKRLPLLHAVLVEVERREQPVTAARYTVDTAAFVHARRKLGLGSSAAACVAFTQAVLPSATRELVYDVAKTAHRAFQGGGSGIDIAACTFGGLVNFNIARAPLAASALPDGLALVVVFTGYSTTTQHYVQSYRALADRLHHASALSASAVAFMDACAARDANAVVGAVTQARVAMAAMGRAAHIDIVSDAHEVIAALARAHGGDAKPSGAGGGDIAVAFVEHDARATFAAACTQAGFVVVDVGIDAIGVVQSC